MTLGHLDCSSGLSGDMFLGALVDAGLPISALRAEVAKLRLSGYRVLARAVTRSGLRATRVEVSITRNQPLRRWQDVKRVLSESRLQGAIKEQALSVMRNLFRAEARVHGVTFGKARLHELGALDCLVDVVGSLAGIRHLGIDRVSTSAINTGSGKVQTEHGLLPVPAPATAELLRGLPVYSTGLPWELTTPTGAALVSHLCAKAGPMPEMTVDRIGVGAGSRDVEGPPNVLRIFVGSRPDNLSDDGVFVLESNIDDMDPRIYSHVMELLLKKGALDVFLTPIIMKKSRPAVRLSAICPASLVSSLQEIFLRETTTFGVRAFETGRRILDRRIARVETRYGRIRVKLGALDGRTVQRAPEYEDCRRAATRHGVSLDKVIREAQRASKGLTVTV